PRSGCSPRRRRSCAGGRRPTPYWARTMQAPLPSVKPGVGHRGARPCMRRAVSSGREAAPGPQPRLGLLDATALVAGSMIGSGIFIVSADIARRLPAPGWLLVVWTLTGVLTVAGALSYGRLAGAMPRAGGQYVYLRELY